MKPDLFDVLNQNQVGRNLVASRVGEFFLGCAKGTYIFRLILERIVTRPSRFSWNMRSLQCGNKEKNCKIFAGK